MKRSIIHSILLLLLAGCGGGEDEAVTIEFWAMGAEGELVQALVPDFERAHPGIRVEVQQLPWTSAHEKVLTAFAGNATPDLSQLGNTWVPELEALGALEDLGPWVARSAVVDPADYFRGVWDTNVIEGRLYGVPWYVDTRLLFYRKDLLEAAGYDAPPETWAGWKEAMRRIQALGGPGTYGILLPVNEFEPPLVLALQQPDSLLREGGRYGNFRSEGFRRAFTFYVDLFREGLAPRVANTQISNVWQEFANGLFAFYITGPWNIGEFSRRLPEDLQDAWMTAPMPGPSGPGLSNAGGSSLVMYARSEHKPEAWAFIEYLSRPDVQARFYEITGDLPARESAWEDAALAGNVYAESFREQLRRVEPVPKVPEADRISWKIAEYAEKVVLGGLSIDDALAQLDRDVDQILEKRRWLLDRQSGGEGGFGEGERARGGEGAGSSRAAPRADEAAAPANGSAAPMNGWAPPTDDLTAPASHLPASTNDATHQRII